MGYRRWRKCQSLGGYWITRLKNFKLQGVKSTVKDPNLRVCSLIDNRTMHWNLNILQGKITPEEAMMIGAIPLLSTINQDLLVWPYEKNGEISVRSTYALIREESKVMSSKPSTSHQVNGKVWTSLWNIK